MKIAIDASAAVRQLGGVSEYAYRIIESLGRLKSPHDYYLATVGRDRSSLRSLPRLPRQFHEYPIRLPYRLVNWFWRVVGWPKLNMFLPKFDLFFAPHFLVPPVTARRLVVAVHDVLFLDHPEWFTPTDAAYFRQEVARACRRADHVLTLSQASKDSIIRHQLIAPDRISIVHLAGDFAAPTDDDRARVRAKYSLPEEYFLFIGTIEPRKNIMRLLAAQRVLIDSDSTIPLVIAGRRGWIGEEFDTAVTELGPDAVRVLGSFDLADRDALLAGATALVFPTLAEGFGIPVLEAMSAGVPVLTSNCSSLPEVAGDAALLVDPTDVSAITAGMRDLATNDQLRQRLITAGLARSKQFTWHKAAERVLAIFEKVGA